MDQERIHREAAFHDHRFEDDHARASVGKFYAVTALSKSFYAQAVHSAVGPDSLVLEYGCGAGGLSLELMDRSRQVHAIDLSVTGLRAARKQMVFQRASAHLVHLAMNGECLAYKDQRFDLVFGSGILHHLDLPAGLQEVARVLKPSGRAVFFEPLGHNVLINLYRRLTPRMRTADEHPLLSQDLETIGRYFSKVEVRYFHLCSLAAVVLRKTPIFSSMLRLFNGIDRILFRLPLFRRQAWIVVISVQK